MITRRKDLIAVITIATEVAAIAGQLLEAVDAEDREEARVRSANADRKPIESYVYNSCRVPIALPPALRRRSMDLTRALAQLRKRT